MVIEGWRGEMKGYKGKMVLQPRNNIWFISETHYSKRYKLKVESKRHEWITLIIGAKAKGVKEKGIDKMRNLKELVG